MYKRIKLNYNLDSLEPHIDKETMDLHYNGHHKNYETKLNNTIRSYENLKKYNTVEELMKNYQSIEDDNLKSKIRENGGGLINHNFFFDNLKKDTKLVDSKLKTQIIEQWESVENFLVDFKKMSINLFGSGWVWLVKRKSGDLKLIKTFNQDNPWFLGFVPVIAIDLWEHSYYLKHNTRKDLYIDEIIKIIDWEKAVTNFEK